MSSYITDASDQHLLTLVPDDTFTWTKQRLNGKNLGQVSFFANNFLELTKLQHQLPTTLELEHAKNFTPLQDHLLMSFTIKNVNLPKCISQIKNVLKTNHFTSNYLLFPINSKITDQETIELLLLVPTSQLITKAQHDWYITKSILPMIKSDLKKELPSLFINSSSQFNRHFSPQAIQSVKYYAIKSQHKNAFIIDREVLKKEHLLPGQDQKKPTKRQKERQAQQDNVQYSEQKLHERLNSFTKEPETTKILKDEKQLRRMLTALANDQWNNSYPKNFPNQVLEHLASLKLVNRQKLDLIYEEELAKLKEHPDSRLSAPRFGEYLQIYKTQHDKHAPTLSAQFISNFGPNFKGSADTELNTAIEKIAESYPPALLDQPGRDKDNVVIFNPLTGVWEHNEDEIYGLLTAIRPSSKATDLDTMLRTLGAQARNRNAFIKPYSATTHLLFKNCVLERQNRKIHALDEEYVRDLHFTDRARLNINYDPSVKEPPIFKGCLLHGGGDWNPEKFMSAYAGNDKEKLQFLYFLLSLGLFGGHNSRVNVSFQGMSRWGKTTLLEIFNGLYNFHTMDMPLTTINNQFAFSSYRPNISIMWFNECNVGIEPLNDTYGTPRYDGLADPSIRFEVKHKGDYILRNPPQVYVDGTSFIPAKELTTGPAGRTLVFKFPSVTGDMTKADVEHLRNQAYASDINGLLHNEKVLQYLVNKMLDAFDHQMDLPDNEREKRLNNLELTLAGENGDLKYFPACEKKWRNEMISSQGDVGQWFKDEFEEYLSQTSNPKEATIMHDDFAYLLYQKSYMVRNAATDKFGSRIIGKERFSRQLHNMYETNNWAMKTKRDKDGNPSRRIISTLAKTKFNISQFQADNNELPEELDRSKNNGNLPFPFGKRDRNWYELIKVELNSEQDM